MQSSPKWISGIGALTLLCTVATANDEQWTTLDRDIEALAANAPAQAGSFIDVSGLLRTLYTYTSDDIPLPTPLPPVPAPRGFIIQRAQIDTRGQIEDFGFRIQLEAAGGTAQLLDGWAAWDANEHLRVSAGNFRAPFLWESLLEDDAGLFIVRTDSGELFYGRDAGAMIDGQLADSFHWALSVQNGFDGVADDYDVTARAGVDVIGEGIGMQQGVYGLEDGTDLTVNASYREDSGAPLKGGLIEADAQFRVNQFWADAQFIKLPDDPSFLGGRADSLVWALSAAYMLSPDKYEIAIRYQDTDNVVNDTDWTIGVNRYIQGHDLFWQVNFVSTQSDVSANEREAIAVALSIRI